MAVIFAKIDLLREFQAFLPDKILDAMEKAVPSLEVRIESTKKFMANAEEKAENTYKKKEKACDAAFMAYLEEKKRVDEINQGLEEGQEPVEPDPGYYLEYERALEACERAEKDLSQVRDAREDLLREIRSYYDSQQAAINGFKEVQSRSAMFMGDYTDKLMKAKKVIYPDPSQPLTRGSEGQQAVSGEKLPPVYDSSYTDKDDMMAFLAHYKKLPRNFITKSEAKAKGWRTGISLDSVAPGMCIGGDVYANREGHLPEGHKYFECDISTLGLPSRNDRRIVYSDDMSLIYYTDMHYQKFELIYGEEKQ
ncbi:MAG: hypothetical protein IJF53_03015 [Clostridia bacterium]|nr:hypothetical protein [Clostridia bacterium]